MIKKVLFLSLAASIIYACGTAGPKETYYKGYKTISHKATNDKKPSVGEYVFFYLDVYNETGKLLESSPRGDNMPALQMTALEDVPKNGFPVIELMQGVSIGDSVSLYIPMDSVQRPEPYMVGSKTIEFVIQPQKIMTEEEFQAELVKKQEEQAAKMQEAMAEAPKIIAGIEATLNDYLAGKSVGDIRNGPDGLKIIIIEEGEGPTANDGQMIDVHYAGYLENMSTFDDSYKRGRPYSLRLGQGGVIAGWDKGLVYLNKGAKAILDIPYELAYGAAGRPPSIPAKSRLLFYVEMTDIK